MIMDWSRATVLDSALSARELGRIHLSVVRMRDTIPVPGAVATLSPDSAGKLPYHAAATIGMTGKAVLYAAPDSYYLRVMSIGYRGGARRIGLRAGSTDSITIRMDEQAICD